MSLQSFHSARGLGTRTLFLSESPSKSTIWGTANGSFEWTASVCRKCWVSTMKRSRVSCKRAWCGPTHRIHGPKNVLTTQHFSRFTGGYSPKDPSHRRQSSLVTWESAESGSAGCLRGSRRGPAESDCSVQARWGSHRTLMVVMMSLPAILSTQQFQAAEAVARQIGT